MEKNDPNKNENRMIIRSVELEKVLGVTSILPEGTLPEVAFAGKSNVGKSSLINALLNRKSLARVSQHPGKTQTINYYNVNKELYLVDLPGYGYAEAAEEVKAKWGKMVERYLKNSEKLMNVFLLVDSRALVEDYEGDNTYYFTNSYIYDLVDDSIGRCAELLGEDWEYTS